MLRPIFWLCALGLATLMGSIRAESMGFPQVAEVEIQPLRAQARRIALAMDQLGQGLAPSEKAKLDSLGELEDSAAVRGVQEVLDPLCLAAVEIGPRGVERVTPSDRIPELVEQGWRLMLVKVINRPGATGRLLIDSPNARAVPNAPQAEVDRRWLGHLPFTGQPLRPNLSGLGLEYTVVQVYSRDPGKKTADLNFRVEGGTGVQAEKGPVVREWTFDKGPEGWKAENNCTIENRSGSLFVTITDQDPFITAPVRAMPGRFLLRFWADFNKSGVGQVFWWTKERPMPDGGHQRNFSIEPGRGVEYEVEFDTDDELAGIRIDPGNDPAAVRIDWITLAYETDPSKNTAGTTLTFDARPSVPVTFRVSDSEGQPATAGFVIRDQSGRVYPAQAKRLAPDFFFQPQVYRASGETVRLPSGTYSVDCSRGPESIAERKELVVKDLPLEFSYQARRWVDPSKRGWWSGDHHIHAAGCLHYENPTAGVHPTDMLRHIMGEDLKVGCCLTWGPCFDYQKQFFTGKPDDVSRYPYVLRYDVEVSGFGSHESGHLNLLKLTEQIPEGGESKDHWPTLGMNTLRWAKKQGEICGPAHSSIGLSNFVGRVEGAVDGPNGVPHFNIPAYDGIGANEFIVQAALTVPGPNGAPVPAVDFISTMNTDRIAELTMWYHVLNCGFRVRASGETDFPCMTGDRLGVGRVYVKVDGKLDFDRWVQGIADGRSYVSDGRTHLMDFTATAGSTPYEVGVKGSEIALSEPSKLSFQVTAAMLDPTKKTSMVELIVNGFPVEQRRVESDGREQLVRFTTRIERSSWVAIRAFPGAHTNPFFITVAGKPIRASRNSALWCAQGVDQCWVSKERTYKETEKPQAKADYAAARAVYRKIASEASDPER